MLTNIVLVLSPLLGAYVTTLLLIYLLKVVVGKFKDKHPELNNIKFGQIIGYSTLFLVLSSGYELSTSPLTRPVTEIIDKGAELSTTIRERNMEVVKPVLVDTSFKSEQEDLSGTPLLDEVVK